ncbi:MAG: GNAT family N-acetyltransferase [Nocardioidaceae bacterium]
MWTERELISSFRLPDSTISKGGHVAYDGDTVVGTTFYGRPLLDNTEKTWIDVAVVPGHRGEGIGDALLQVLVEAAREAGRTTLLASAAYPFSARADHPHRRFAERHGFSVSLTEVRRSLTLPVPDDVVRGWIGEAAAHHGGYRIQTFHAGIESSLVDSFLEVFNQLTVEAPQGDVEWEAEAVTREAFEQRVHNDIEAGRDVYSSLAITSDDQVVAYSTLSVPAQGTTVSQWGTLVASEHRGSRLGLAVKAAAIAEVQRRHPGYTRIDTTTAEVNAQMVAINEHLGYTPVEIQAEFQLRLP